jgi:hypothetical protein
MELRKSQRGLQNVGYDTGWITCFPVQVACLPNESNYCLPARCPSQLYFASFTAR